MYWHYRSPPTIHKKTFSLTQLPWRRLWRRSNVPFFKNLIIFRHLYHMRPRPLYLYLLSSAFMFKAAGHRYIYRKIKGRFARVPKPLDHLGNINPEDRINVTQIIEEQHKMGTSFEDMDIFIR